jgi:uncharacterized membrane protein
MRHFFRTALVGLSVVILPFTIVAIIGAKAYQFLQILFQPILRIFGDASVGGLALAKIVYIILLLLLCFLAGKLADTKLAKRFISMLEDQILVFVPGYQFIKGALQGTTGLDDKKMEVVLVKVDDPWQIAFLIEELYPGMYTVFVPGAPNVADGSVYHVEEGMMMRTEISQQQALRCLRQLGYGSSKFLKDLKLNG